MLDRSGLDQNPTMVQNLPASSNTKFKDTRESKSSVIDRSACAHTHTNACTHEDFQIFF
jgi:hypothetical protein